MDFSYLNKESYNNIPLWDESHMNPYSDNRQFFIRKHKVNDRSPKLHRHTYVQINYVYKGRGYHIVNDKKFEIFKGDIFIVPPYVPHVILSDNDTELEIFEFEFTCDFVIPAVDSLDNLKSYLDFAYLEPFMVVEEELKPRFNLDESTQKEVESILEEVRDEYENQNQGYILVAKALLLKLLVITGRAFSQNIIGSETEQILNRYKRAVCIAKEYIEENYAMAFNLKHVASLVNYSTSRFSYLFKAVTGKTCVEFLNEVRINAAKTLLKDTDKSVLEISLEVGYNSINYFNKNFKLICGTTPSNYRLNIKN